MTKDFIIVYLTPEQKAWLAAHGGRSKSDFIKSALAALYPDFPPSTSWGGKRQPKK